MAEKKSARPYGGSMSTAPNAPHVGDFVTQMHAMPTRIPMTRAEQDAFSGSGYAPASPAGTPGAGGKPSGTKKGLPT